MQRSLFLDFLKGFAIIVVILFHSGLFTYGYLGVEIFLVVGGYLITKSLYRSYDAGTFSYIKYFFKRILRLWPVLIIVSSVSLLAAYFVMLPDNMKNVAEDAIGSLTFTNNFIQYITSGSYWDQSNDFKPLMHTWYIALMMQFYIVFPILLLLDKVCSRKLGNGTILLIFTIVSLLIYLLPFISDTSKFYLLPARFFEFGLGALVAVYYSRNKKYSNYVVFSLSLLGLFLLMALNCEFKAKQLRLLLAVALTLLLLITYETKRTSGLYGVDKVKNNIFVRSVSKLGLMSYSLYLWHQVILAFYRYCIGYNFTFLDYALCIALSVLFGWSSFIIIEKKIINWQKKSNIRHNIFNFMSFSLSIVVVLLSYNIYQFNGIVRDIPELSIDSSVNSESPQKYNEKAGRMFDNDFKPGERHLKILVVGDSYGRDWINVLIESGKIRNAVISYHTNVDSILWERSHRADVIFLANKGDYTLYSDLIPLWLSKKFWRVGNKKFEQTMGPAYFKLRYENEIPYFSVPAEEVELENREKRVFGKRYLDIMGKLEKSSNMICLITPEKKLISHDGFHLTFDGAKYIASLMSNDISNALK